MTQKQKQNLSSGRVSKKTKKCRFSLALLNKGLFVAILVSGCSYVFSTNDLSIKGFVLQELKKDIVVLENENKITEIKIMEIESYENIDKKAQELNMVKIDKIDYIDSIDTDVAMK